MSAIFKHSKFFTFCLILFLSTLEIPRISLLILILLPFIITIFDYLKVSKSLVNKSFLPILLLFLFSLSHYIQVYVYQYEESQWSFKAIIIINVMFIVGIFLNYRKMPFFPFNIMIINFCLFGGLIVWAFLSVFKEVGLNFDFQAIIIQDREIASFWVPSSKILGTRIDNVSILGISLISLLFTQVLEIHRISYKKLARKLVLTLPLLALAFMGLYNTVALSGRKPFIVLGLSLIVPITYYFILKNKFLFVSLVTFLFIIRDILIGIILDSLAQFALETNIGNRFLEKGLESARYEVWLKMITDIWKFPWGGRKIDLPGGISVGDYAHNLWLDVGNDTGLLSMFLLLGFHLLQIPIILNLLNLNTFKTIKIFIICSMLAFLLPFISEPILRGPYYIYFGTSCFFFGSLIRLDYETKRSLYFPSKLANLKSETITK